MNNDVLQNPYQQHDVSKFQFVLLLYRCVPTDTNCVTTCVNLCNIYGCVLEKAIQTYFHLLRLDVLP